MMTVQYSSDLSCTKTIQQHPVLRVVFWTPEEKLCSMLCCVVLCRCVDCCWRQGIDLIVMRLEIDTANGENLDCGEKCTVCVWGSQEGRKKQRARFFFCYVVGWNAFWKNLPPRARALSRQTIIRRPRCLTLLSSTILARSRLSSIFSIPLNKSLNGANGLNFSQAQCHDSAVDWATDGDSSETQIVISYNGTYGMVYIT